jgi:hypothetical protein
MFGGAVDDAVLAGRVRSKLGFLVRHPSAIEVQVSDGRVTLSGPVLSDEVQPLVRGIAAVRGMRILENRLEVHESAEEVHRLQGPATRPTGQRIDLLQSHWSPSTRFLVASSAAFLLLNANRHRISLAPLAALASVGYLLYGLSQEESAPASQGDSRAQAEVTAGGTG